MTTTKELLTWAADLLEGYDLTGTGSGPTKKEQQEHDTRVALLRSLDSALREALEPFKNCTHENVQSQPSAILFSSSEGDENRDFRISFGDLYRLAELRAPSLSRQSRQRDQTMEPDEDVERVGRILFRQARGLVCPPASQNWRDYENNAIEIIESLFEPPEEPSQYSDELYNADPACKHEVYAAPGGGVKCRKCPGWFCY
jgi:hypothetical protein